MAVERAYGGTSLVDVVDRILDKGLVIDLWARVSLVGIELLSVEARVVVASVDTYLRYAEAIGLTSTSARPQEGVGPARQPQRLGEAVQELTQPLTGALGVGSNQSQALGSGQQPTAAEELQGGQQQQPAVAQQLRTLLDQLERQQGGQPQ